MGPATVPPVSDLGEGTVVGGVRIDAVELHDGDVWISDTAEGTLVRVATG